MERNTKELRAELLQLLEKQLDSLDLESAVGMTDAEWREYEKRQLRIHELSEEILRDLDRAA